MLIGFAWFYIVPHESKTISIRTTKTKKAASEIPKQLFFKQHHLNFNF